MTKGIAQSKRNNAWHTKHTNKIAEKRINHNIRMSNRKNGVDQMNKAEKQYRAAQFRESLKKVNFWDRIKMPFKRMLNKPIALAS